MTKYTVVSFAPVQGFIEKSRKLRDLIGASQILSYLSGYLINEVQNTDGYTVISPALSSLVKDEPQKGLPNLIIIKHKNAIFPKPEDILKRGWQALLKVCRDYIENTFEDQGKLDHQENPNPYCWKHHGWEEAWKNWGNHAWEIFVDHDGDRQAALDNLEAQKLNRAWIAINWTGESSSLSGQDAICYPRMGLADYLSSKLTAEQQKKAREDEEKYIKKFYENLADATAEHRRGEAIDDDSINKFINTNERLSLPELVKRLATRDEIIEELNGLMPKLEKNQSTQDRTNNSGFRDIIRVPRPPEGQPTPPYRQWTGWFMGDGDCIGDHLKDLKTDEKITQFSDIMRSWGKKFSEEFKLGRVIYAGGDDFFGVIYDRKFNGHKESCITGMTIIDWLMGLKEEWHTPKKEVNFSMGFVWAAPSVPQRDILQHCREAEKLAKSKGKDRVTIRVVFNSGQYVQWTCPWDLLSILKSYRDRDGGKNWGHIYSDLAQLESRHAFCLGAKSQEGLDKNFIADSSSSLNRFMSIYFPKLQETNQDPLSYEQLIKKYSSKLFPKAENQDERNWLCIGWGRDLIQVGWQLCRGED